MKIESSNISPDVLTQLKSYVYDIIGCCQDVHKELGPWLNEYMYQEALKVAFQEKQLPFVKEYYFQVSYHGVPLEHKHFMDFLCKGNVAVECKAIASSSVQVHLTALAPTLQKSLRHGSTSKKNRENKLHITSFTLPLVF